MLSMYPACFYKEAEGYSVVFPDLNNLATQGDTFEEAMEMAVDCLAGYLYTCKRDGETIPTPSRPGSIDPIAVSRALAPDEPVPEAFVNVVSVDVAEYAKQHFERSVKKTLSCLAERCRHGTGDQFFLRPSAGTERAAAHGLNRFLHKTRFPGLSEKRVLLFYSRRFVTAASTLRCTG